MSLGFKVVPLESALRPHNLLYLFFGAPVTARVARLLGNIIAQHPPGKSASAWPFSVALSDPLWDCCRVESRRYLTEAVMVWARHASECSPELTELRNAPLKAPELVRYHLSREMRASWPRKEVLACPVAYTEQLVRILHNISKRTSELACCAFFPATVSAGLTPSAAFNRSGDRMIHATLYADMDERKLCALSLHELPYQLTSERYGAQANRNVRPLFEEDPEIRFSKVDWKRAESSKAFALICCLLAETHGKSARKSGLGARAFQIGL